MNRREAVLGPVALGASALLAPFASLAQQPNRVWRIGFLVLPSRPASFDSEAFGKFLTQMRELGYVEGRNLAIEWRFAEGRVERLPALAGELVRLNLDVIVSGGNDAPLALQKATTTIPIVLASSGDPVGLGLVKSLARPGGNITGVSTVASELIAKRLEILLDLIPGLSRVTYLLNPAGVSGRIGLESVQAAARKKGATILPAEARTPPEIDAAFALARQQNAGAMIVTLNPLFLQQRTQIAGLAAKYRLPSMTADRLMVEAGCLMCYGADLGDSYRQAADYVVKIIKGAKAADLPVEQPTKYDLVINLKTANALGLTVPPALLARADRVIE